MSMNVHLKVVSKGMFIPQNEKLETEVIERVKHFSCFQTSTDTTRKIINDINPLNTYKAWVLENFDEDEKLSMYADNDPFGEHGVIGFDIYNEGREHLEELDEFLALHEGWDVIFFEM